MTEYGHLEAKAKPKLLKRKIRKMTMMMTKKKTKLQPGKKPERPDFQMGSKSFWPK
jgi:hypothetical protein